MVTTNPDSLVVTLGLLIEILPGLDQSGRQLLVVDVAVGPLEELRGENPEELGIGDFPVDCTHVPEDWSVMRCKMEWKNILQQLGLVSRQAVGRDLLLGTPCESCTNPRGGIGEFLVGEDFGVGTILVALCCSQCPDVLEMREYRHTRRLSG